MTCPRPHSQLPAELGPAPGQLTPETTLTPVDPAGRPSSCLLLHTALCSLGRRCETCDDGFFGDPLGLSGDPQPCRRCQCSGNVDPNAVGNCDPLSGHCLRCLFNTTGARCERCRDGFYGSALAPRPADKCVCESRLPASAPSAASAGSPPSLLLVQKVTGFALLHALPQPWHLISSDL